MNNISAVTLVETLAMSGHTRKQIVDRFAEDWKRPAAELCEEVYEMVNDNSVFWEWSYLQFIRTLEE